MKRTPLMDGSFKTVQIIPEADLIGWDCLLEGIKVPDMTRRQKTKTMQERFREMEPDVFDVEVDAEQMRDWIYGF